MVEQQALDLHRIDILAADLEHVLVAPEEAHVAVLAPDGHVARAEPAVLRIALGGLGGLLVVAEHQAEAAHLQLALGAGRAGGARPGIDDAHLVAGRGIAGGLNAVLQIVIDGADRDAEPDLRHAEAGDGAHRLQYFRAAQADGGCALHAGGEQAGAQAGEVARAGLLRLAKPLHMGLEAVHHGHALGLDQVQALVRVEGCGQDLAGAEQRRHQRALGIAEGVEQRQVVQDGVPDRQAHLEAAFLIVADELVGVHRPLGEAGGAGGVHDERHRIGIDLGRAPRDFLDRHGAARLQRPAPVREAFRRRPLGDQHDLPQLRELRPVEPAQHGEVIDRPGNVVRHKHDAVRLLQHIGEVAGAEARVHRHGDRADLRQREVDEHPFVAIGEPERDMLARADAEPDQRARRLVHPGGGFGEGVAPVHVNQRLAVRPARCRLIVEIAEAAFRIPVLHARCSPDPAQCHDMS